MSFAATEKSPAPNGNPGFTLIELLLGMTFLTIGLLAIAAMFPMAFMSVHDAGRTTTGLTAARQILEDLRTVPFDDLANLNGFDTNNSATLPADQPERDIARRWRYALAGEGSGFAYTTGEKAVWSSLAIGGLAFGRGRITVATQSATMLRVTVTITIPRRPRDLELTTLVSRM
jgi:Tfp pilus assembly protein PilV